VEHGADRRAKLNIRFARPDEAPDLIELLRRQHGRLYPCTEFYDRDFVADSIAAGRLFFAVADDGDGGIAGMICANARQYPDDVMAFSLLTVLPAHRGLGLGGRMQDFLDENLPLARCAYACMHCLTMDTRSQLDAEKRGYTPTGLLPHRYFFDKTAANLADEHPPLKRTHLLMCRAFARRDAGTLYCPEALKDFVATVYDALHVAYAFAPPRAGGAETPDAQPSLFRAEQDERHSYCEIFIERAGDDLAALLRAQARLYDGRPAQTYSLMLNMAHESCLFAYPVLRGQGYVCTGAAPLAAPGPCLLLCRLPSRAADESEIATLPSFRAVFAKIKDAKPCLQK
jgi:GNAT superfamily N-acetyltransferase